MDPLESLARRLLAALNNPNSNRELLAIAGELRRAGLAEEARNVQLHVIMRERVDRRLPVTAVANSPRRGMIDANNLLRHFGNAILAGERPPIAPAFNLPDPSRIGGAITQPPPFTPTSTIFFEFDALPEPELVPAPITILPGEDFSIPPPPIVRRPRYRYQPNFAIPPLPGYTRAVAGGVTYEYRAGVMGEAYITAVAGSNLQQAVPQIAAELRIAGFNRVSYAPINTDNYGAARQRLFDRTFHAVNVDLAGYGPNYSEAARLFGLPEVARMAGLEATPGSIAANMTVDQFLNNALQRPLNAYGARLAFGAQVARAAARQSAVTVGNSLRNAGPAIASFSAGPVLGYGDPVATVDQLARQIYQLATTPQFERGGILYLGTAWDRQIEERRRHFAEREAYRRRVLAQLDAIAAERRLVEQQRLTAERMRIEELGQQARLYELDAAREQSALYGTPTDIDAAVRRSIRNAESLPLTPPVPSPSVFRDVDFLDRLISFPGRFGFTNRFDYAVFP